MSPFAFITDDGLRFLDEYKFAVQGGTPLDNLLVPYWRSLATLMPRWISPNLISVSGGLCALLSAVLSITALLSGASWLCICSGALLFLYMHADSVDGPHARNTGQTSQLGALVDHGVDAFVAFTTGVSLCATLDPLLASTRIMAIFCAIHTILYVAQWAELETGRRHDTRGGVESVFAAIFVLSLPGIVGMDVYRRMVPLHDKLGFAFAHPVPLHVIMEYGFLFCCAGFAVVELLAVFWKVKARYWWPLAHIVIHDVSACLLSTTPLHSRSALMVFLVVGMNACQLMTKMRIAASTHSTWPVVHKEMLPYLMLCCTQLAGVVAVSDTALAWLLLWQVFAFVMTWYDSITRICAALKVPFLAPIPKRD